MTEHRPLFQINVVVEDLDRARDFYSRLGWNLVAGGADRAVVEVSDSLTVDFDATGFRRQWDPAYSGGTGGHSVINVFVGERATVDALYAELTAAGYPGRREPWDAFWGCRYAIVTDADGNLVGLMSERARA